MSIRNLVSMKRISNSILGGNVKNKVSNMKEVEIKFKIDELTYLLIEDLLMEKTVNEAKFQLQTNQVIGLLCQKALKEFIMENQSLLTEKLARELSLIDENLEGKEIKFEDVYQSLGFLSKAKEGD